MAPDPGSPGTVPGQPGAAPPGGLLAALPPRTADTPHLLGATFGDGTAIRVRSRAPHPPHRARPAAELTPEQAAIVRARAGADPRGPREPQGGPAATRSPELLILGRWQRSQPEDLPMRLEKGQVQIRLPFKVDVVRLTRSLVEEGYRVAYTPGSRDDDDEYDPDPPGVQSWGPDYDPEGYYPFNLFPDPGAPDSHSIFAFPPRPEDIIEQDLSGRTIPRVDLGEASRQMADYWVRVLGRAALPPPPGPLH